MNGGERSFLQAVTETILWVKDQTVIIQGKNQSERSVVKYFLTLFN